MCALSQNNINEYCEMADILLLTGGININPGHYRQTFYGKQYETNCVRDALELRLFHKFFQCGKPVFGIGRGMQLINVALGGTLIQNLVEQAGKKHNISYPHRIMNKHGSLIHRVFGDSCIVNSSHDQAVDLLGEGLQAVATSLDGVVEAIACEARPIYGVQFHLELLDCDETEDESENRSSRLLKEFMQLSAAPTRK